MKNEICIQGLVIGCLMLGCAAPASPPQPTVDTPTATFPTLTSTPLPAATSTFSTPTLTSEPGLRTSGPYFAYFQQENLVLRLVFVDADGGGRKVIELPKAISDSYANGTLSVPDIRWLSPDGKWLAFYTGSVGAYGNIPAQGTADLTLNLLNLKTGETQVVTPLLSKDYPNSFAEAARRLNDPDKTAETLFEAFVYGITKTIAWSPDGQYLAFGGQMDGLSSDLYLYQVETKTIQRLSSGDQELQWINWSPDGKWIVHSSLYSVGAGMTFDIYAATIDGLSAPYISTNILYDGIKDWLNARQYFENNGENGPGEYGLRLVDLDTGNIIKIWDGSFSSYAVDKSGRWVAVFAWSPDSSPYNNSDLSFVPAIYLINLTTLEKSRVEFPDAAPIQSFGLGGQDFVIMDQNPVFLSKDGSLTQTDLVDVKLSVSPNSEYWLAATSQTVEIFSAENTPIKDGGFPLPDTFITDITWRPDSAGVFLVSEKEIYAINIPGSDIKMIEMNLIKDNYVSTYKWINGQ